MSKKRPSKKQMAARIRRFRRKRGMTQRQLAEHMGVAERTLQYWEAAETLPRARDVAWLRARFKRARMPW